MDNTANGTATSSGANAPAEPATRDSSSFWALTLGSVGVVYGDIGTSPLYAFREALVAAQGSGPVTREIVLGVLSLIVWSLIVVVTLKYIVGLLRMDNNGEGGTLSLAALAFRAVGREDWSLYDGQHVVFQPQQMSPAELLAGTSRAWKQTYTYAGMGRRLLGSGSRLLISVSANLGYRFYAYNLDRFYTCDWQLALRA